MTIPTAPMDDAMARMGTSLARAERRLSALEALEFPIPPGYRLLGVRYYYYTGGVVVYTPEDDVKAAYVEVQGGGGGGGGRVAGTDSCGGGGGGGGYAASLIEDLSGPYNIYVGSGGVSGTTGGPGEASTFGDTLIIGRGGEGGSAGIAVVPPAMTASGGRGGGSSGYGLGNVGDFSQAGEGGGWGIGMTATTWGAGFGGGARLGGGGFGRFTYGNGQSARDVGFGGGGGGGIGQTSVGGAGGHGLIAIWEFTNNPSGGTGAPIVRPGDTVVAEQTFGQSSFPGTSLFYSRDDHSHGTPPAPSGGGGGADPEYPVRAHWFHDTSYISAGTSLVAFTAFSQLYASLWSRITPADGDEHLGSAVLAEGDYTLRLLGVTSDANGLLDIDFKHISDGSYTNIVTGQDWYTAVTTYNAVQIATFTVVTPGRHIFKFTINGKNASSSSYNLRLTKYDIYLTSGDS